MTSENPPSSSEGNDSSESVQSDDEISIDKEQADELRKKLRQIDFEDLDSKPPVSRGSSGEMIKEAAKEIEYNLLNDIVAVVSRDFNHSRRTNCDVDGPCFRNPLPFWLQGLVEIIYLIIIGAVFVVSVSILHSLDLNSGIILLIEFIHLALYLMVILHHLVDYIARTVEAIREAWKHLREH